MRCNNVREELVAYIDGELSSMGRHAIEAHLSECEVCATECENMQQTIGWTCQAEPIEPASDWWETLQEGIQTLEPKPGVFGEIQAIRSAIGRLESRLDATQTKEVMTLEDVAAYLQLEPDNVWNLLDEIPHFQVGYELRFKRSSVDDWIRLKETGDGRDLLHWDIPTGWLERFSHIGH
jgi:hypothetical protein